MLQPRRQELNKEEKFLIKLIISHKQES